VGRAGVPAEPGCAMLVAERVRDAEVLDLYIESAKGETAIESNKRTVTDRDTERSR
jgi:hypothetical protein